jgi:hypothetical protein
MFTMAIKEARRPPGDEGRAGGRQWVLVALCVLLLEAKKVA